MLSVFSHGYLREQKKKNERKKKRFISPKGYYLITSYNIFKFDDEYLLTATETFWWLIPSSLGIGYRFIVSFITDNSNTNICYLPLPINVQDVSIWKTISMPFSNDRNLLTHKDKLKLCI